VNALGIYTEWDDLSNKRKAEAVEKLLDYYTRYLLDDDCEIASSRLHDFVRAAIEEEEMDYFGTEGAYL